MVLAVIVDLSWTFGLIHWMILNQIIQLLNEKNSLNEKLSHFKVILLFVSKITIIIYY